MRRPRIPPSSFPPAFTTRQATRAGMGQLKTDSPYFFRHSYGVWGPATAVGAAPPSGHRARLELVAKANALASLLPGSAVTHETAAVLLGMPLPPRGAFASPSAPAGAPAPAGSSVNAAASVKASAGSPHSVASGTLHFARSAAANTSRRKEVKVWRTNVPAEDLVRLEGLDPPVTSIRRTLLLLARTWSVPDLVCAVDWAVRIPRFTYEDRLEPYARLPELSAWLSSLGPVKGKRALAEAVSLARVGSDSPQETRLRLALAEAGLPEPVCNPTLLSAEGRPLPPPDLAFPEWRVAVEYQCAHHFGESRSKADIDKRALLEDAGWLLVEVHAGMAWPTWSPAVERIRRGLRSRGAPC
ncbi:hypothetical protein [Arthrobacter sp. UM1]|uniref:hypothetical protein n=1 Tax=Arthrobacter sp. UM1 TaxID=2766776 RepID=UPI001CF6E73E|nr:hypothetical protein [Arthrobacter sp. UM1]MCB4209096.1 hypothetical protein [Arthrobacter sp. UM1]